MPLYEFVAELKPSSNKLTSYFHFLQFTPIRGTFHHQHRTDNCDCVACMCCKQYHLIPSISGHRLRLDDAVQLYVRSLDQLRPRLSQKINTISSTHAKHPTVARNKNSPPNFLWSTRLFRRPDSRAGLQTALAHRSTTRCRAPPNCSHALAPSRETLRFYAAEYVVLFLALQIKASKH